MDIRVKHKKKLVRALQKERKNPRFLEEFDLKKTIFEGLVRAITPNARQILLLFFVMKRYLELKEQVKTKRVTFVPRVVFIGGMSRPGDDLHL